MRSLPILVLTLTYFGVAFASYSQVAAEDRTEAGPNGRICRLVTSAEARTMNLGDDLTSSVDTAAGTPSATTGGSTGSLASSRDEAATASTTMTSSNGRTVITLSDGTCVIISDR